jgi:hypothetical protein
LQPSAAQQAEPAVQQLESVLQVAYSLQQVAVVGVVLVVLLQQAAAFDIVHCFVAVWLSPEAYTTPARMKAQMRTNVLIDFIPVSPMKLK